MSHGSSRTSATVGFETQARRQEPAREHGAPRHDDVADFRRQPRLAVFTQQGAGAGKVTMRALQGDEFTAGIAALAQRIGDHQPERQIVWPLSDGQHQLVEPAQGATALSTPPPSVPSQISFAERPMSALPRRCAPESTHDHEMPSKRSMKPKAPGTLLMPVM